jgi:hypothetical protein
LQKTKFIILKATDTIFKFENSFDVRRKRENKEKLEIKCFSRMKYVHFIKMDNVGGNFEAARTPTHITTQTTYFTATKVSL